MGKKSTFGARPEQLNRLLSAIGLDKPNANEQRDRTASLETSAGRLSGQIGRYKLLRVLGEGGMGIVYLAEQTQPIKRKVALKVIKPGMDSKRVIARFEAERQALALLDHPNIAHVYDAGTTENGRPYFVMEYVEGLPITEHCDRHKLTIEERLKLFIQICEAVQHAHQKGIIHRDIKPTNIIVSIEVDKSIPKIIDFGVAKALSQPLTEKTLVTEHGQMLGTPEYMSPEQAEMTGEDIDTRSDIYSLGILLYELLTGVLPFEAEALRKGGINHARKMICEQEPKTPSTRLSRLSREKTTQLAKSRRAEPGALQRRLRGDLDWITLKAMEKDRTRRYASVGELGADIIRHLKDEPVVAGPPGTAYRVKKFIRRHKAFVTGIAAVLIVSVIGTIVSVIFALGKIDALSQNKAIAEFMKNDILEPLAAENYKPANIREVFDVAAEKLGTQFRDYPLLEADMRFKFGSIYTFQFGDYDKALSHLERALEIQKRESNWQGFYMSMNWLGLLYTQMGKYHESEETFRDLLKRMEEGHEQGKGGLGPLYYAAKSHLGNVCRLLGRYDEAEPYICEAPLHPWWEKGHWRQAMYEGRIAGLHRAQGRYDEAKQIYEDLLLASRKPFDLMKELGITYTLEGNLKEAEPLLEEALEEARKEFGEEHMNTTNLKIALAVLRTKQERHTDAELLFDQALWNMQNRLDEDHPELLKTKSYLGVLRREQDRYNEAEKILSDVIQDQSKRLGFDHPDTLESMYELAILYIRQSDYEKAQEYLLKATTGRIEKLKLQHPKTQESIKTLIELYEAWKKPEQAEQWRAKLLQTEAIEE
jgi:serine/threonine protein kinase